MNIDKIPAGKDVPNDINVIIEIPAQASPVKYEVDKDSGALLVDRFMATPMFYPCNYGFVPHTLSDDGDPVDVLVMTPHPLLSGSVIRCRPVGMLNMTDEAGEDAKLLAVPVSKLYPEYDGIQGPDDVSPLLLEQIRHFFEHYKELEPNKWVKVQGWEGADAARAEIESSIRRFQEKG
ncbi:inorganic diphosphatase [Ectothiorhodospira mobilis]|uniref:Inorganic pyrophosphatase n=1 Tax=Ectothiorhodospira mobilis TaxID=195064 RepID=A0A1I4STP5_ECTMO|nr:inorganic diphosphatase [Ectothiorhodospira mobilis]MCG5536255.1 inorganic diphosphatase [Ectothiorhodospira mobilis]SFM67791.1 inorganic pyrophosphatase [Ectothiorhodospira mobilis]